MQKPSRILLCWVAICSFKLAKSSRLCVWSFAPSWLSLWICPSRDSKLSLACAPKAVLSEVMCCVNAPNASCKLSAVSLSKDSILCVLWAIISLLKALRFERLSSPSCARDSRWAWSSVASKLVCESMLCFNLCALSSRCPCSEILKDWLYVSMPCTSALICSLASSPPSLALAKNTPRFSRHCCESDCSAAIAFRWDSNFWFVSSHDSITRKLLA